MMQTLNDRARDSARNMVKKKFVEASSLDDIATLRNELQNKLAEADAKLKTAVQGKLDSLKRGVDIMEESSGKLQTFTENIDRIEARIAQTNTVISRYPNVKRVHYARDNLNKVIAQVEFFVHIPERVSELRRILDDEPERLKEVYLESLKLQAWRSALMKELQTSRERRLIGDQQHQTSSISTSARPVPVNRHGRVMSQTQEYSDDMYVTIIGVVGTHLEIVLELSREIRSRIWGNIDRIFEVAEQSPADLVGTFEIIEMHQEYVDRRMERVRAARRLRGENVDEDTHIHPSELGGGLDEETGVMGVTVKQDSLDRLQNTLNEKVETSFVIVSHELRSEEERDEDEDDSRPKQSEVVKTLHTANGVIEKITEIKHFVSVCVPDSYDVMSMLLDAFELHIRPKVLDHVENTSKLEVSDLMELIHWLEHYDFQCSAVFMKCDRVCCQEFLRIAEELVHEYLYRIKSQVMGWFNNIKSQKVELGKSTDGTLITTMPEDMFNVIHMQVAVAREKLTREHLKDVVNACLQVLRDVQRQSYDSLATQWRTMDVETMCATINDTHRMQEKCKEFDEQVVQGISEEEDRTMLVHMLEDVAEEYVNLAIRAVGFLARLILQDLEEVVFHKLFTPEWEQGEGNSICGTLSATIQDYFRDIEEWLPEFFYCRLTVETLKSTVYQYCMSLRRIAVGAFQFNNELTAARHVMADMDTLRQCFIVYAECLARGGLETAESSPEVALDEQLEPLSQLARVVSATHISGAADDVKALCCRWGRDALKLVNCAISCNPSLDRAERQECIESSAKMYEQLEETGALRQANKSGDDYILGEEGVKGDKTLMALKKTVSGVVGASSSRDSTAGSKWNKVRLLTKDIISTSK